MRWCSTLAALLVILSAISAARDDLQLISSSPLPAELRNQFGWGDLRVGCEPDGSTILALVPAITKATHGLVVLTSAATVKARIEVEQAHGLEQADIQDFAPGPDGDIYILARAVVQEHFDPDQSGKITSARRRDGPALLLVHFNATGQFVEKTVLQANLPFVQFAVFHSGSLLTVGYSLQGEPMGPLVPFAGIFSRDGLLVRAVALPGALLDRKPDVHSLKLPVPMLGNDGRIYVVSSGQQPALAVVRSDGILDNSVSLHIPKGFALEHPRLVDDQLIAQITALKRGSTDYVAEMDLRTGDVLFLHALPKPHGNLICQGESPGIIMLNAGSFQAFGSPSKADHR